MDQDMSKLQKDVKGAASAPKGGAIAKADAAKKPAPAAPKKPHADQARRKLRWSDFSKKLLLPASILMLALGLFLIAYNVMLLVNPSTAENAMSKSMLVSSVVLGVLVLAAGALGLLKRSKKLLVTLAIFAIVYAAVLLAATAKSGAAAIASGVAGIVLPIFFVLAVDGMFDVGIVRYFHEMFGETKKLTWLSGKDLFSHTLAVFAFVLAMAALIYVLDLAFSSGFSALSNIGVG